MYFSYSYRDLLALLETLNTEIEPGSTVAFDVFVVGVGLGVYYKLLVAVKVFEVSVADIAGFEVGVDYDGVGVAVEFGKERQDELFLLGERLFHLY